VLEFNSISLL